MAGGNDAARQRDPTSLSQPKPTGRPSCFSVAGLMKVQADLFERSVRTMRKPSKAVKSLAGSERQPKRGILAAAAEASSA